MNRTDGAGAQPHQGSCESYPGSVVACELVSPHCDAAPLLKLVEAAFDHVSVPIAGLLLRAEIDRSSGTLATVGNLVVSLGDRRGNPAPAQPRSVRLRWVALIGEHPIRARTGSSFACSGNQDPVEDGGHHCGVVDVPAGEHPRQGSPFPVRDEVDLAGQPAAGAADRMIRRLGPKILVIRWSPLWCGQGSRRAGAHARSSSRSTPPSPRCRSHRRACGPLRASAPRCRPRPTG